MRCLTERWDGTTIAVGFRAVRVRGGVTMDADIRLCRMPNGAQIAYTTLGAGTPLVFVPGWLGTLARGMTGAMRSYYEGFARRHLVVGYDRYGCGLSDCDRTDFSLGADLQSLEAVVEALKLKRFALYGSSAGGPVAIAYAAKYPRRVSHLILYGTRARMDEEEARFRRVITDLVRLHWDVGARTLVDLFTPGATAEEAELAMQTVRATTTAETAAALWEGDIAADVAALCPRLKAPTLILHREGDRISPFRLGRELAGLIPNATLVPLPGDRHLPTATDQLRDGPLLQRLVGEFLGDPIDDITIADAVTRPSSPPAGLGGPRVFVSHAAEDRDVAGRIAAALEAAELRCWVAPRDIEPGQHYAEAIIDAIDACHLMVVVFSAAADASPHVNREVEQAASRGIAIIPFRVADVTPSKAMRYFLSTPHWLNAFDGSLQPHIDQLVGTATRLLTSEPSLA